MVNLTWLQFQGSNSLFIECSSKQVKGAPVMRFNVSLEQNPAHSIKHWKLWDRCTNRINGLFTLGFEPWTISGAAPVTNYANLLVWSHVDKLKKTSWSIWLFLILEYIIYLYVYMKQQNGAIYHSVLVTKKTITIWTVKSERL